MSTPGDSVDQGVVGLGEQGEALARESLDQPQLPQRLGAVELLGEDAPGHPPQLLLGTRARERRMADVVLEVEAGVVDPERAPGLRGRIGQLLAKAGNQRQASANVLEQVGRTPGAAPRRS